MEIVYHFQKNYNNFNYLFQSIHQIMETNKLQYCYGPIIRLYYEYVFTYIYDEINSKNKIIKRKTTRKCLTIFQRILFLVRCPNLLAIAIDTFIDRYWKQLQIFSELYWISGSSEKSIVRGTWTRDAPRVLISAANLNLPRCLQYDVTSKR